MELVLTGIALVTLLIFIVPLRWKNFSTACLVVLIAAISSSLSVRALLTGITVKIGMPSLGILQPDIIIDSLSAFFILTVNFTAITGILYSRGYLRPYLHTKNQTSFSLHYFSYIWLHLSMLLLCMFRDGFSFLLAWELMTISSFILVMFDAEQKNILRVAINYLIQMHIGMVLILAGFMTVDTATGAFSFDALPAYFNSHPNLPLFLLFFAGFAIKAGFIPFHTWLPEAHPAAPSHVSGVMSGVMIKMGIYGIFRIIVNLHDQLFYIGVVVLVISVLSGLYGVMLAILQHDLKKLLAYHSIENIGIIGIGLGLGILGMHFQNSVWIILGFSGALLHVLNHSLFKSLLFFSAGSVYQATHTRNVEELGGLIKNMPKTGFFFLLGALAICGLPPFNGFISEFLIYSGLFNGLGMHSPYLSTLFLGSIISLALIGGLAIFCFTKAFGITFLGRGRSEHTQHIKEAGPSMLFPKLMIGILIIFIGLLPVAFVNPITAIVLHSMPMTLTDNITPLLYENLWKISLGAGVFVLLSVAVLTFRYHILKRRAVTYGPTWGCGYTAMTPKFQYTSTSFSGDYANIVRPVVKTSKRFNPIAEEEIFPQPRSFETHSSDSVKTKVLVIPVNLLFRILRKMAVLQTGRIQHYLLYALLFMMLVFGLTYFKII